MDFLKVKAQPEVPGADLIDLDACGDGKWKKGQDGVLRILTPKDKKEEFVVFKDKVMVWVKSAMGYPAMYPLPPADFQAPAKAVLMDLDGTQVRSEHFWMWTIEQTTCRLLGDKNFKLVPEDEPHVAGHSVSEHLQYCIKKYAPTKTVEEARRHYFDIVRYELGEIMAGRGNQEAFHPAPGLKDFLKEIKGRGIKIGLVTSGLHEKAWPGIVSVFRTMGMGDPLKFYDAIITAGTAIQPGQAGTLGELEPKPHPWLYAETARVGLGIDIKDRNKVVGIEDSGAGVMSILLAGFCTIGIADGNIEKSGSRSLCHAYCPTLTEALPIILGK